MCGADPRRGRVLRCLVGSSPRVRGRPVKVERGRLPRGLIPACAEQTDFAPGSPACHVGSSPRVRGRRVAIVETLNPLGLIPACAGQTHNLPLQMGRPGAHPRVCGADDHDQPTVLGGDGLIPACAGQTSSPSSTPSRPRAHPRVCGADLSGNPKPGAGVGSSPRVRGRPCVGGHHPVGAGLIPACAGQT